MNESPLNAIMEHNCLGSDLRGFSNLAGNAEMYATTNIKIGNFFVGYHTCIADGMFQLNLRGVDNCKACMHGRVYI